MHSDNEQEDNDIDRRNVEFKMERFQEQSRIYLNRLPTLKQQLNEINRLHQFNSYVQKLNEIDEIVQNLAQNIRNIEQLHRQLNEKERTKLDLQITLLRTDTDREISEFHTLRDQAMASSIHENSSSIDDHANHSNNPEQDSASNELRQRHLSTTNRLTESYDLLEQDLITLRETIGEVAKLVAQQQDKISNSGILIHMAHDQIRDASTLLHKAVHSKYVTMASGALLGASLGGPVGFVMGLKLGALVALSGSAVGALSANLMQRRRVRNNEARDTHDSYNQAML